MLTSFERTLMHGHDYEGGILAGWLCVEKFNGHRVRWTGSDLRSRRGHEMRAPRWFVAALPACPVDMELFASKAGGCDEVTSILRSRVVEWRRLSCVAFDVPGAAGDYQARHARLVALGLNPPALVRLESNGHADRVLAEVLDAGGEGLMLHRPGAAYVEGRTRDLLKLLPGNAHWL